MKEGERGEKLNKGGRRVSERERVRDKVGGERRKMLNGQCFGR